MKMPQSIGLVHFIGIGGIGMSGIAEVLHNLGHKVQGSDQTDSANVQRLREKGIEVFVGHAPRAVGAIRDGVGGDRTTTRSETRCGCFLPDLTGLARRPPVADLRPLYRDLGARAQAPAQLQLRACRFPDT